MNGVEKRKFKRKKINIVVTYRDNAIVDVRMRRGRRDYEATMIDLNETGAGLVTDINIPTGALMTVKFNLADQKVGSVSSGAALLTAKAIYSSSVGEGHFRVGIQFQDLNRENKDRLKAFCCGD